MTQKKRSIVLGGACLLAFVVPACSSDGNSDSTVAPAAPAATDAAGATGAATDSSAGLTISGNAFSSPTVTAGTAFTVTNNDSVGHTVTDDAGAFDEPVPAGETITLTIPDPGTYAIHCEIHSSMHGTINVT